MAALFEDPFSPFHWGFCTSVLKGSAPVGSSHPDSGQPSTVSSKKIHAFPRRLS